MDDKMFEELCQGVEQAISHAKGEKDLDDDQIHFYDEPDPREIRKRLGLTQNEFAGLLDVSVGTLRNWEQGRRKPQGPAKTLLRVADCEPEALLEVLGGVEEEPRLEHQFLSIWHSARGQSSKRLGGYGSDMACKTIETQIRTSAQSERRGDEARSADDYSYAMAV
jgi:putative transcriptional regulator